MEAIKTGVVCVLMLFLLTGVFFVQLIVDVIDKLVFVEHDDMGDRLENYLFGESK